MENELEGSITTLYTTERVQELRIREGQPKLVISQEYGRSGHSD